VIGAWLGYPLVLLALAYGAGVIVQLAAGRPLPGFVRLPCGLALVIVVMDLCTRTTATATLAVPAVAVIGVAGLGAWVLQRWRDHDRDPLLRPPRPGAGAAAALVVFALFAAPVVLSGHATWLGYNVLNDSSIWLAIVDQALAHGRTISDLPPSTYSVVLSGYLTVGYPIGSFLPLGIGHALLGQDIAWLIDPWMAFVAALLALAIYGIARRAVPASRPWVAAVAAGLSTLSTLLYGYYLWGGIKELVGALLIATAALTATLPLTGERRVRAAVPVVIVIWALIAALSPGGLIWIGPGAVIAVGLFALRGRLPGWRTTPPATATATTEAAADAGARTSQRTPGAATKAGPKSRSAPAASGKPRPATARKAGRPTGQGSPRRGAPPARTAAAPSTVVAAATRARDVVVGLTPAWRAAIAGVAVGALGLFLLLRGGGFVTTFHSVLTSGTALGVLPKPLNPLQAAGIWPSGDFRYPPAHLGFTYALIGIAIASAAVAFTLALRAGRWAPVLYLLFALSGAALAVLFASPWIAAKALASASPALPLAALLGGILLARRNLVAGALLVGVIGAAIVWGDLRGYHDARLAPRALFASLASIAPSISGQGPTLMTEYSVYGARHFLRDAAAEDPGDERSREDPLLNGSPPPATGSVDLDDLDLGATGQYPTLVIQGSPVATRPSEPYTLIRSTPYWQVWQRPQLVTPRVLSYLPVGDVTSYLRPAGVPACRQVLALAGVPGVTELAAAPAVNPIIVNPTTGSHPAHWAQGSLLAMHGSGSAQIPVQIPAAGRFSIWLARSIQNPTSVSVDGRPVGTVSDQTEESGQFVRFGDITLSAGRHVVTVRHMTSILATGSGQTDLVGPLVLAAAGPTPSLISVPPNAAQSLCGRSVSWIDALGP